MKVELKAFSLFTPLDLKNSMLPATVMHFTVTNKLKESISASVDGCLENAVLIEGRKNIKTQGELVNVYSSISKGVTRLSCGVQDANEVSKEQLDYGSMSLSIISEDGKISVPKSLKSMSLRETEGLTGDLTGYLSSSLDLAPGQSKDVTFVLTWYFPKSKKAISYKGGKKEEKWLCDARENYYAELYKSADDVSDYIIKNRKKLIDNTLLF